jgi:hypothetical protein
MLIARWKQVLFGALFQYVHGIFTQLAHRMHQPQEEPLGDLGFRLMPVRTSACLHCHAQALQRGNMPVPLDGQLVRKGFSWRDTANAAEAACRSQLCWGGAA